MKTLNLAHRGFSGKYPENTRRAMLEAVRAGCDGVESDVHLSRDGIPVIIHDAVLNRTTTGSGPVSSHTYDELRALDIGSWMSPEFASERIMTLDQLLDIVEEHDIFLNLELKNYEVFYPSMESIVVDALNRRRLKEKVFLSSFNHASMCLVKSMDSSIKVGYLFSHPLADAVQYAQIQPIDSMHPKYTCLQFDRALTDNLHRAGIRINTWTVNDPDVMRELISQGVDGIITNFPDILSDLLSGRL